MVKGTANRISSTASSPAVHPSTRHGARRFDCPQAAGSVIRCTRAPARRDCRRPCHPTRLIPGRLPQNRQLPRPRRWRARSPRLLGARAARCARLVPPRALSAIRSPLLHSRALPPWLRVLCASRRVTFLRRGTTAVSPTSSSSARAAAPPSTAAAAAAAAAATAVRGPVPLLFRPSVRLNRPPLVLSGARGAAQTWRGRMHRGLRDAGRAGASTGAASAGPVSPRARVSTCALLAPPPHVEVGWIYASAASGVSRLYGERAGRSRPHEEPTGHGGCTRSLLR